ncbi:hypothetical protein BJX68DRAFT_210806 [Aspergillus pseudodeflectus]|uniref:FAD-binding FR-type domain-containing protein n=1 Tax=Aspergillus pseudodeflectus TaxID=176178 RepID=A0ABR4JHV3_9EURO
MPPTTSPWYYRISHISQTDWYGICAAIALGTWLVWRLASRGGRWAIRWHVVQIRRLFAYPLPRPFGHLDMATVQQGSVVTLLLTANILPLVLRTRSWATLHRRAANLAVINFIPLWTGWTFGFPAHLLGIDWSAAAWMHRWVGRIVIIHSVLHGAIAVLGDGQPVQAIRQHYVPVLVRHLLWFLEDSVCSSPGYRSSANQSQAACSMILILPVTLHAVVRRYPQLAMKCHYLLAVTGLASTSYHVWMRHSKCLWGLVAAAALWIFLTLASLTVPLRRRWGHSWPSVVISRHHELLSIDITVPSGWRVEPGQYVYLWLPQAGLRLASQLPLFYVSSWEATPTSKLAHLSGQHAQIYVSEQSASQEDTLRAAETLMPDNTSLRSAEQGGEWRQAGAKRYAAVHLTSQRQISRGRTSSDTAGRRTLRVLARPQSSALVAALYNAEHRHIVPHRALVLGPYGRAPDLARFGIVLLIVEDIGIARVFSLIQTLVLASEQHRAMVRKLIVVWQMEDLGTARCSNLSCLPQDSELS